MSESPVLPTDDEQLTLCEEFARQAYQQLSEMYQLLGLKGAKDFETDIWMPTLKSQPDPNDIEDELENKVVSNVDLMKLSCAYLLGAMIAEDEGDHENAWVAVTHAQYWMGVATGSGFIAGAQQAVFKKRASVAGAVAAEKTYGAVKMHARELAERYLDYTPTYAAKQIKDQVTQYQDDSPKKHFRVTSVETIAGWLKDLPFKGKYGPRGPNVKN